MTLNVFIKQIAVLMPLLLLCACGEPQPQNVTPQSSPKTAAIPKPKLLWPQASQIKALPNYGKTSRVFTRFQNASAGEKFFQAYQARQPGRWEEKATTQEGDPFFTRFYYLGKGTAVYVERDDSQAKWSENDRTWELCDRLTPPQNNQSLFSEEGCHLIDEVKKVGE